MVTPTPEDEDTGLDELIAAYLAAEEAGRAPDPATWVEANPGYRQPLARFLANHTAVRRLATPFRAAASALRLEPDTDELAVTPGPAVAFPRRVGGCTLLREVGRGGMGVVYLARQETLGRLVAVKMIRAGALASAEDVRRFRNEAETVAALDHPHIVPVYEVGEWQEAPADPPVLYFTMKYVEGGSLAREVGPAADTARAARLVAVIARATHHAHQRGVLHRDLKPSNILLDGDGQPHVTDFGLAKRLPGTAGGADEATRTQTQAVLGTPGYMAPEQAWGTAGADTTASDVYGLGAVLYRLLTGVPPFRGASPMETALQAVSQDPDPPRKFNPRVDRDLGTVCRKCLAAEPERRYPSALAVAEDLERWLHGQPIQARPAGRLERLIRWGRRNPLAATLGAAVILLLLAGVAGLTAAVVLIDRERTRAVASGQEAEAQTRVLRRYLYGAQIRQAVEALEFPNLAQALALLDAQAPGPGREDLRGFEWYYLRRQCNRRGRVASWGVSPGLALYGVTFAPDGRSLVAVGQDRRAHLRDVATGGHQQLCSGVG